MGEWLGSIPDAVWGALALVASGALVAYINQRGKKPETTSSFIDDLMSRLETVEKDLRTERQERRDEQDDAREERRVVLDYVEALRQHISEGLPPPPPAWPMELNRRRGDAA